MTIIFMLSITILILHSLKASWGSELLWMLTNNGCFYFVFESVSKLIKLYHCHVYSCLCHFCYAYMHTKMHDLSFLCWWSSLLGKNTHNLMYCGYTKTKVMDSLYILFDGAQLSVIYIVTCASRSCTTNGNPLSVSERNV